MHRVVPELIVENYRLGRYQGEFSAVVMFLDLSGFSTITDALMQHGQHGAEVLASLMHGVFDPLVESVFDYGGKIIGFAGDGMMALFPIQTDTSSTALYALTSAYVIQKRLRQQSTYTTVYGQFSISAKIGLAIGPVSWGILVSANRDQATYYFRGAAVNEAAEAEHHASAGDILLTTEVVARLPSVETDSCGSFRCLRALQAKLPPPSRSVFPPVDLNVSRLFMPADVVAYDVRGEFRQVVNLFMRFPDLSEPQLHELMDKVFELRGKYGGLLSRVDFGDKGCNLLMLWGAPVAYENDIGRALNFLLDLKSQVDFQITSGVTYYIAHAGYLGSSMCEDYTCYGWGVNLASRFMMSAPGGETWVDDRIARRVSKRFEIEFVGSQSFKGFAAEQKVHRLSGHRQTVLPIYQGELVGREDELSRLAKFIEPLGQKRFAGLMLISGDAGVGKGRLVYELRTAKMFDGEKILWAVCQSDQILRQSFNPWRNWLYKYFGVSTHQSQEERKPRFSAQMDELLAAIPDPELARELDRTRSILGALLDLYWDGSLYEQLDAEGRYNNTLLALIALLKAESLRQPVVIVLEDVQFIDNDSKEFLPRLKRAMLGAAESYPVAIIVTTRPSGFSLAEELVDGRIDLHGISRQAIAHLAETMLGGPAAPTLIALLANRSEGNPYFAEQIIRYLQEENSIEMSRDGWSLVRRLRDDILPGDIRSILVARLDQLAREVKLCIQTASILGREFELQVLLQMLRDNEDAITHVNEAEKAAIWAPLNEIRYIFSHGLLRDAAYEIQMRARRQELHALAVDALESLYADDLRAHYAALAYHADQAKLSAKAQKYYMQAGKSAADLYQNSQAIDYYTRALTHTPQGDLRTRFEILTERVGLLNRIGERDSQLKDLDSLETLAHQIGEAQLLIKAQILHAQYCFTMGDYACTIEMSEEVAANAKELGQAELALSVYVVWSQAHFRLGNLQQAMRYATDGLNLARQAGQRLEEGRALSSMGLIALESKEPGKAQKYLEEAVVIAREIKDRTLESRAVANLANSAAYVQRDYMTARAYYEQANTLNGELGDRYAQGIALGNIGWVCGMLGDFATAQQYHEQALLIAREIGNLYHETHILMNLSGVAEAQGKVQEAVQFALGANSLCKEKADKQSEAWSWLYLGYAYLADGNLEDARIAFEQALNLRRERGQHSLATEPAAGLIQVALRVDDLPLASRLTEEILSYLSADGTLEGAEEPARVYLACYSALERASDERASVLLDTAMDMLESQVSKIKEEQARHMYIQNVPWRRAIEQTWLAKNKKSREPYP